MTGATLVATVWLYIVIPKGFLPLQDTGLIFAVMEGGQEVSFTEMKRLQATVEDVIRKDPEVTGVVSVIGVTPINATPNAGRLAITLRPRDQRKTPVTDVIDRLQQAVAAIPGVIMFFQPVQDIQISTRLSRAQYQYTLTGTDAKEVDDWAAKLTQELQAVAGAAGRRLGGAERRLPVAGAGRSRDRRAPRHLDADHRRHLERRLRPAPDLDHLRAGQPVPRDPGGDAALPERPDLAVEDLRSGLRRRGAGAVDLADLERAQRHSPDIGQHHGAAERGRALRARHRSAGHRPPGAVPGGHDQLQLAPDASLSDAVRVISQAERTIGMPSAVIGSYSGDAAEFAKSLAGEPWLILAAAITIYIVLGVLYESFIHPLTILSTLPSAGVGALLALMLYGYDLSVVALIGIVLLMGIVKKNAIMMIDFALEAERKQGLSPRESIVQASLLRFRPIMMTTLAALFGAIPLAFEAAAPARSCAIRSASPSSAGCCSASCSRSTPRRSIYLAMERLQGAAEPRPRRCRPSST